MKRKLFSKGLLVLMATALIMSISANTFAQGQKGMGQKSDSSKACFNIPNLTADQQTKIEGLRTKHIKEVTPLQNELAEKRAHLNTLESVEKPDMAAINKTIDEISAIDTKLMKLRASHRVEVASLLTDEQKVAFKAHQGKGMGQHNGTGMGQHKGMGIGADKEGKGKCAGCPHNKKK